MSTRLDEAAWGESRKVQKHSVPALGGLVVYQPSLCQWVVSAAGQNQAGGIRLATLGQLGYLM